MFSPHVSLGAELGKTVRIGVGVIIRSGVRIGAYTYVNHDTAIESGSVGKFCSIGARVSIGPAEHPKDLFTTHPITYKRAEWGIPALRSLPRPKRPPRIGNDVWIGRDAFILSGIDVGNGAIVGANAVVTRDVPAYAIVAGVPAVVRGYRFPPEIAEELNASAWWDHEDTLGEVLAPRFRSEPAGPGA